MKKKLRLLFVTDMHGSEGVWRKFLNASAMLKVDLAICGGDLTGKMLVPVVNNGDGTYTYYFLGKTHTVGEKGIPKAFKEIVGIGYYPIKLSREEYEAMRNDPELQKRTFTRVMMEGVDRWLSLVREKVPSNTVVMVCPGNDDRFEIDEVVAKHSEVVNGEGRVVEVKGYEIISSGWTNPTPWKTAREEPDEKLEKRLRSYISKLSDVESSIFNFHAPPYQSQIDSAPLLDENFNPVLRGGRVVMVPVGSKAVRKVIEEYQPLIGLHGHIHESSGSIKIGRTWCVNPGSEYAEGILRGFLIELDGLKIRRLQRIEG